MSNLCDSCIHLDFNSDGFFCSVAGCVVFECVTCCYYIDNEKAIEDIVNDSESRARRGRID